MYLQSAEIRNFRGIRHLCIDFEKDTSVLLGENTWGKSSLLYALFAILGQGEDELYAFSSHDIYVPIKLSSDRDNATLATDAPTSDKDTPTTATDTPTPATSASTASPEPTSLPEATIATPDPATNSTATTATTTTEPSVAYSSNPVLDSYIATYKPIKVITTKVGKKLFYRIPNATHTGYTIHIVHQPFTSEEHTSKEHPRADSSKLAYNLSYNTPTLPRPKSRILLAAPTASRKHRYLTSKRSARRLGKNAPRYLLSHYDYKEAQRQKSQNPSARSWRYSAQSLRNADKCLRDMEPSMRDTAPSTHQNAATTAITATITASTATTTAITATTTASTAASATSTQLFTSAAPRLPHDDVYCSEPGQIVIDLIFCEHDYGVLHNIERYACLKEVAFLGDDDLYRIHYRIATSYQNQSEQAPAGTNASSTLGKDKSEFSYQCHLLTEPNFVTSHVLLNSKGEPYPNPYPIIHQLLILNPLLRLRDRRMSYGYASAANTKAPQPINPVPVDQEPGITREGDSGVREQELQSSTSGSSGPGSMTSTSSNPAMENSSVTKNGSATGNSTDTVNSSVTENSTATGNSSATDINVAVAPCNAVTQRVKPLDPPDLDALSNFFANITTSDDLTSDQLNQGIAVLNTIADKYIVNYHSPNNILKELVPKRAPEVSSTYRTAREIIANPLSLGSLGSVLDLLRSGKPSRNKLLLSLLMGALFMSRGQREIDVYSRPIIILEDIESRFHPTLLINIWSIMHLLPVQKIVTTNSSTILSAIALSKIRRLSKRYYDVHCFKLHDKVLSTEEERKVAFHIHINRPGAFFARCWILVEGETEVWMLTEIANLIGFNLACNGIHLIEFAQCGLGPIIKLAKQMGIAYHVLTDGDDAGKRYAQTVETFTGNHNLPAHLSVMPHVDIEHYFYTSGFADVFQKAAELTIKPMRQHKPKTTAVTVEATAVTTAEATVAVSAVTAAETAEIAAAALSQDALSQDDANRDDANRDDASQDTAPTSQTHASRVEQQGTDAGVKNQSAEAGAGEDKLGLSTYAYQEGQDKERVAPSPETLEELAVLVSSLKHHSLAETIKILGHYKPTRKYKQLLLLLERYSPDYQSSLSANLFTITKIEPADVILLTLHCKQILARALQKKLAPAIAHTVIEELASLVEYLQHIISNKYELSTVPKLSQDEVIAMATELIAKPLTQKQLAQVKIAIKPHKTSQILQVILSDARTKKYANLANFLRKNSPCLKQAKTNAAIALNEVNDSDLKNFHYYVQRILERKQKLYKPAQLHSIRIELDKVEQVIKKAILAATHQDALSPEVRLTSATSAGYKATSAQHEASPHAASGHTASGHAATGHTASKHAASSSLALNTAHQDEHSKALAPLTPQQQLQLLHEEANSLMLNAPTSELKQLWQREREICREVNKSYGALSEDELQQKGFSQNKVIEKAIHRKSKPGMAILVCEAMQKRGPDSVPLLFIRMFQQLEHLAHPENDIL